MSSSSFAQTTQPTLAADIGFSGVFRPDSLTPVFVSVADPTSRPGTIEIRTARGRVGNVVTSRIQSNPKRTTFTLYAQLDPLDRVMVEWRDDAGKRVANVDLTEETRKNPAALGGPVFGVAGAIADANRVAAQLVRDTEEYVAAGAIPTKQLPERSVGYQSLDVLVLPELNTDEIDDAVEAEIVAWMRAGGIVIAWPGAQVPVNGSPLAAVLPAEIGDVVSRTIDGKEVSVRSMRSAEASVRDLSDSNGSLFARSVGLGQIALFGFDPTRNYSSIEHRLDWFRRATLSQVSMSPDDRREGRFDPLVFQARGEEVLRAEVASSQSWLMVGLMLGIVLGPGEALLLLLCRRPIFTPLTMAGLAIALGAGVALLARPNTVSDRSIEVAIEDDAGVVARAKIANSSPSEASAVWLVGSSANLLQESAGELSISQRQDRFIANGPLLSLSEHAPRVRTLSVGTSKPMLMVDSSLAVPSAQVQSSDEYGWAQAIVLSKDQLKPMSHGPESDKAMGISSNLQAGFDADDSATARRETAIEALANQPGWEPILMDRHLGQRLVRLFESEGVAAIAAKRERGSDTQFVIHIQRP